MTETKRGRKWQTIPGGGGKRHKTPKLFGGIVILNSKLETAEENSKARFERAQKDRAVFSNKLSEAIKALKEHDDILDAARLGQR
jgi:hypothetical protein